MYQASFDEDWPKYFNKLEHAIKEHAAKKIKKILVSPQKRHLKKGARFFVDEIGQYRLIYRIFEENNEVRFYFIGNHKEYEKWYKHYF
ncbi:MAG: hypothetical protein J7K00_00735 [Candidatus Diapherotrites archaeon]|nr:hypothetical protein [Candidatus Diapherotrites archaeon]